MTNARKITAMYMIPLMILGVCACFNVFSIASLSNIGGQIHDLEVKRDAIRKQNDELELTLSQTQSLASLKAYAQAAGFVPVSSVKALQTKDTKLAMQP